MYHLVSLVSLIPCCTSEPHDSLQSSTPLFRSFLEKISSLFRCREFIDILDLKSFHFLHVAKSDVPSNNSFFQTAKLMQHKTYWTQLDRDLTVRCASTDWDVFFLGGGRPRGVSGRAPKDLDVWNEGSMLPDKMDNLISPTLKNPRG